MLTRRDSLASRGAPQSGDESPRNTAAAASLDTGSRTLPSTLASSSSSAVSTPSRWSTWRRLAVDTSSASLDSESLTATGLQRASMTSGLTLGAARGDGSPPDLPGCGEALEGEPGVVGHHGLLPR